MKFPMANFLNLHLDFIVANTILWTLVKISVHTLLAFRSMEAFGTNTFVIINTINAGSLLHTRVAFTGINNCKNIFILISFSSNVQKP